MLFFERLFFTSMYILSFNFVHVNANFVFTTKQNTINQFVDVEALAKHYNLKQIADFGSLKYFSGKDNENAMLENIFDVEEDTDMSIAQTDYVIVNTIKETSVPWHRERISRRKMEYNNTFPYNEKHSCHRNNEVSINTYIVDTGIDVEHSQFEGRAVWGTNFADSEDTDCNNHGTHVAGLVGSKDYGVCVDANLIAVKVLDCDGSGTLSGVIKGIEWAYKHHTSLSMTTTSKKVKGIINMSLGGGYSRALNRAVEACDSDDFHIVVASGNENSNSCKSSPASAKNVVSVMASSQDDYRAWFSNYGKCSTLYSPGVDVLSTIPGNQVAKYSGTSMASPVVAGVLNHYLDMYPQHNQAQMKQILRKLATKGVVKGNKHSTHNELVYLDRV
jgi:cerevisin